MGRAGRTLPQESERPAAVALTWRVRAGPSTWPSMSSSKGEGNCLIILPFSYFSRQVTLPEKIAPGFRVFEDA